LQHKAVPVSHELGMHVGTGSIRCDSEAFADLSREILGKGKSLRFRARGNSMWPLVRDGDILLVRPIGTGEVRLGDLVLFHTGKGNVVVHRVVRCDAGRGGMRYLVQGDAGSGPDGLIPAAQVQGRVTSLEREGVAIDLQHAASRALSRLAVVRARCKAGRGRPARLVFRLLKRFPLFGRYLA